MSELDTEKVTSRGNKSFVTAGGIGIVVGMLLGGVAIMAAMPKMNMPLMARMFGGTIAKVMGGSVARDEHAILSGIVKN
ncbi:MAG TPA: hypothetical protein PLU87_14035 [Sedimentisphaerales bacterium]|nr:hypothetical protein [Sedimentisphaerales bacterium]HRS12224.1 hypothetical protein [Sedimentisphaerales bacterium]HRV48813.1 hypothetical protein [Sedimentisphaerales bacterium]